MSIRESKWRQIAKKILKHPRKILQKFVTK
jgi:hypothetical protein